MSTHQEAVSLQVQIWKLREELADARIKLAGTEDRLADALENAQHWRELYHGSLNLPDTEVVQDGEV